MQLQVFVTMLASTIHCRHLMVWKIFAPKLIFESIGIFVTLGSVLVGYLLLIQVHHNVDRLVGGLNKQSRWYVKSACDWIYLSNLLEKSFVLIRVVLILKLDIFMKDPPVSCVKFGVNRRILGEVHLTEKKI